ncbi:MAG: hypothetical protein WBY94_25415 [Polyangiaceae bacterium]
MSVGYVQLELLRSCGNGKLPIAFAAVGVASQLSSPPAPPLDPPPELLLEPAPELELEPPPDAMLPPLLLDPLLPPLPELPVPPDELVAPPLELPPLLAEGSPALGELKQATRPRHPTTRQGAERNGLNTGPPKDSPGQHCCGFAL